MKILNLPRQTNDESEFSSSVINPTPSVSKKFLKATSWGMKNESELSIISRSLWMVELTKTKLICLSPKPKGQKV